MNKVPEPAAEAERPRPVTSPGKKHVLYFRSPVQTVPDLEVIIELRGVSLSIRARWCENKLSPVHEPVSKERAPPCAGARKENTAMRYPDVRTPIPKDTDCEVLLDRTRCRAPGHALITVPGSRVFWACVECLKALRRDGLKVRIYDQRQAGDKPKEGDGPCSTTAQS
jgi:hypothetical protein